MSSYNLKRLLQPKSIALFGGLWIENVANQIKNSNFKGNVWPINPHRKSIAGYKCFQDISDLPGVPDTAFIGKKFAYIFLGVIFGLNAITFIWFFLFSKLL